MKGVIYIIYREYLQVRKKHHFTENKKAHRGFGPLEMTPACVRSSFWPLGSRGIMTGHVFWEEVAKSTGTHTAKRASRMGFRAKVGTQEARSETKTRYVALSRQVSRTETLANK